MLQSLCFEVKAKNAIGAIIERLSRGESGPNSVTQVLCNTPITLHNFKEHSYMVCTYGALSNTVT